MAILLGVLLTATSTSNAATTRSDPPSPTSVRPTASGPRAAAKPGPRPKRKPKRKPKRPKRPKRPAPPIERTTPQPALDPSASEPHGDPSASALPADPTAAGTDSPADVEPLLPALEEEAVEEAPTGDEPSNLVFELRGFVLARTMTARLDPGSAFSGVLPATGGPRGFFELNLQPSVRAFGRRLRIAADATLYVGSSAPNYLLLPNEGYVETQVGPIYVLAGRKRVVWGSGLAANPTDVINPVKNPLDFEQQRAGAVLLPLFELTKRITISSLLAPSVTYNARAHPTAVSFRNPLVASRIYFLIAGTDVNLIHVYDHARARHMGGLSVSRYLGEKLEAHVEALAGNGPSGLPPVPLVPGCGQFEPAFDAVAGAVIGGMRLDLEDQSFLSVEYLFNGQGLSKRVYDQYRNALPCTREAVAMAPPPTETSLPGHPIDPIVMLLRQHYVALVFARPRLSSERFETISLGATAIVSVVDGSLLVQARVGHEIAEQTTLGLAAATWIGPLKGEFSDSPTRAIAVFDLRVTY